MPLAGKVIEVNPLVLEKPESIQEDSYNNGWLVKLEVKAGTATAHLLDHAAYQSFVSEQAD